MRGRCWALCLMGLVSVNAAKVTGSPTSRPSKAPTDVPTIHPTSAAPTKKTTTAPTSLPTSGPSPAPSVPPTYTPSAAPTLTPSNLPTHTPTSSPTFVPTSAPTSAPTPTACPKTWTAVDLTCVSTAARADKFSQAVSKCEEDNAYLLQFSDATVLSHVQKVLPRNLVSWIGLADTYSTGTYVWQYGPLAGHTPAFELWGDTPKAGGCAYLNFSTGLCYTDTCSSRYNFTCMGTNAVVGVIKTDDFVSFSPTSAPSPSPVTTSSTSHNNDGLSTMGIAILVAAFVIIAVCGGCVYFCRSFGYEEDVGVKEETKVERVLNNIELGDEKDDDRVRG